MSPQKMVDSPRRRFQPAAQPEVMRAAEKDEQYTSFVHDACRDAFRHLLGTRAAVAYQKEMKLLGRTFYYLLTTGSGQQTLGEEYCDIIQVAGPHGLPPTPARRMLFIVYQTAVPYLAERFSSMMTAHGIMVADSLSEESSHINMPGRNQSHSSAGPESTSSSGTRMQISALSKLKMKCNRLWLLAVQKWPLVIISLDICSLYITWLISRFVSNQVLPYGRELLQLVLRTNLMLFYFEGLYYHISKRTAGIHYVFIGKPLNQRPRYQILGVFLLIQLCILGAEGLRRSNLSSIANSINQTAPGSQQHFGGRGLPILNEEGNMVSDSEFNRGSWTSHSTPSTELPISTTKSKCTLCLSNRQNPTATACGHVFCWTCIMEWCNEKPECPLCRTPITHSNLVCIYHADF